MKIGTSRVTLSQDGPPEKNNQSNKMELELIKISYDYLLVSNAD